MPIAKVDGRKFLETNCIIVLDDAVVEIHVDHPRGGHWVALKFRQEPGRTEIRYGNPRPDRTVVKFVNFPYDEVTANGGVRIGQIYDEDLWLAFVVEPYPTVPPGNVRRLTYTLYSGPERP